jgi:hypothetical protein
MLKGRCVGHVGPPEFRFYLPRDGNAFRFWLDRDNALPSFWDDDVRAPGGRVWGRRGGGREGAGKGLLHSSCVVFQMGFVP